MPADSTFIRSALFVDFDNIFIQLQAEDRVLAEQFASEPGRWIDRLAHELELPDGINGTGRKLLIRRCYLNPEAFKRWRPFFVAAGFETIDCPPLTSTGKTSADIHMVLDISDALLGPVHYDEFVVMSADSDFVPVLLKLRKHDRRTTVLASGPSSRAYVNSADLLVGQDDFTSFLLGERSATLPGATSVQTPLAAPAAAAIAVPQVVSSAAESALGDVQTLSGEDRSELEAFIIDRVSNRSHAMMLAALGNEIKGRFGSRYNDRGGYHSLGALVQSLDLGDLVLSLEHPGYLYDPEKHSEPSFTSNAAKSAAEDMPEDMFDVARNVCRLTDTPLMSTEQYRTLFDEIAEYVNNEGDQYLTLMSRTVRDNCLDSGQAVSRQAVNFVIRGLTFSGHTFEPGAEDPDELATIFLDNTRTLCTRAQMSLTDEEHDQLEAWILG